MYGNVQLKLIETTVLSFISTGIKMLAALVINKAVAIYAGPGGIALIGQMQNAMQVVNTFAQGGVNSGVTKYTAEYRNQPIKLLGVWSCSLRIAVTCSLVIGLLLIFLSNNLSFLVLRDHKYAYVFVILGFTVFLFTLNQLLISVLNGLKEIKTLTIISVIQSIYALIFTTILVIYFGLEGALIGLVTNQSVVFFVALYKLKNHTLIRLGKFCGAWDKNSFLKLLSYSGMAITTALVTPAAYLFVRNYIGSTISWQDAGYWQSMVYISAMYTMVISTALNTYYLPKLSELSDKNSLRAELKNGYRIIVPVVILLSLAVYFLRGLIVDVLFSSDFEQVKYLFKWQLIGDVVKVGGFLMSYLMLAKAMTTQYVISEVFFCALFAVLAQFFVQEFGVVGVTYAYTINNVCYLIAMIFITKKIWC